MVSGPARQLTFLPWAAKDQLTPSERLVQSSQRHKHTALAGHRKQREHKKKLRAKADAESGCPLPLPLPDTSRPKYQADDDTTVSSKDTRRCTPAAAEYHEDTQLASFSRFISTACFQAPPAVEISREFRTVLHEALMHQWPAFAASTNDSAIDRVRESAFQTAASSPHTLFAIIYAGCCYQSYFSNSPHYYDLLQLQSKQEALKYLREAVQDADGGVTDSILLTIALLAIHGTVRVVERPRFTAPLYRDNEFYLSVKFDETHLRALQTLVRQRGGLGKLELHGLSNIISMIDTFQSLMTMSKPQFDCLYTSDSLIEEIHNSWDELAWTRFTSQAEGFSFLDNYKAGFQLRQIISRVRIQLETYCLFLRNPQRAPDMMVMVHMRRALQHDALSLEHGPDCLFETARLAAIMYISELGWTLPVVGGFQAIATRLLLGKLTDCIAHRYDETHREFLLWAAVLGGLSARKTDRVRDFATLVHRLHTPVTTDSWIHIKAASMQFMPLEYQFVEPAHGFWDYACDFDASTTSPQRSDTANMLRQ